MQVRIKKNAKQYYISYMVHSCQSFYSDSYAEIMERLSGRICKVDTECLFATSFNVIDPDFPDKIIDIKELFCEEVIGEIRHLKEKCNYCFHIQDKGFSNNCQKCGKNNYLKSLI